MDRILALATKDLKMTLQELTNDYDDGKVVISIITRTKEGKDAYRVEAGGNIAIVVLDSLD